MRLFQRKKHAKREPANTAQESMPFERMFKDGICRVTENYYTKTIAFNDINYQLAQTEDQRAIFDEWCSFLNFFDSSIHFELNFVNNTTDGEDRKTQIEIPLQNDGFNNVREEYSGMLKEQLARGNNGIVKSKYITFGIEADSLKEAKAKLTHIENNLLSNFKKLGVRAKTLNGKERLEVMHDIFHMGEKHRFSFDWNKLVESGLSVKDFIAPSSFAFKKNRVFQMGETYGAMSFLSISASEISDRFLADILDMDSNLVVSMHIHSVDQNEAIKQIKHTITELDRSKIEEQKKAVRAGYDMDIIPSDLATYGVDAKNLLKELQSQNERMFLVTFLIMNTGKDEADLNNNVFQMSSIAQKHNCNLVRLDYQQEAGLMSSLPLAPRISVDGYSNFIFTSSNGKPYTQTSVNKAIDRIIKAYNKEEEVNAMKEKREPVLLPHFSAHNLRHTFCTRLCENESNVKIIQSIMGHADISTTMNIYADATTEKKQEIVSHLQGKIPLI